MMNPHPAAHKAAETLLVASHGLDLVQVPSRAGQYTPAAGVAGGCGFGQQSYQQTAWPEHRLMFIMQASLDVQQETPAYVTATATFLSMIYPDQGLDRCLTREHIERMDGRDFLKVMHVSPRISACTQGCQLLRSGPGTSGL